MIWNKKKSGAYLYQSGKAKYYDENGKKLSYLEKQGHASIFVYVKIYPKLPIYWAVWDKYFYKVHEISFPFFLEHLAFKNKKIL